MRILLAAFLILGGLPAAQAQVRVEPATILRTGIYNLGETKTIKDKSISTGQRTEAKATITENTSVIAAKKDTVFGLDLLIRGTPRGTLIPVQVIWRYPGPGLINPATGIAKTVDKYTTEKRLGDEATFYWSLGQEWQMVPGEWVFEIWYRDRLLARQAFTLRR
jgi:hypothetical protein